MTTGQRAKRQAQIEDRQAAAAAAYPTLWAKMTEEWCQPGDDRLWLLYAANYLFRTGGVRWALDPLTLRQRLPQAPEVDLTRLSGLSFVLLTHRHADHLDPGVIRALRQLPIRWVIPDPILPLVLEQTGLPESQVIIP
jgi:L-ascorbate metabolism protein UlaG (beta-lactamase superfamily)